MVRRLIGVALALLGLWLLWTPVQWAILYINRGAPAGEALADPVFWIPAFRGSFALIGGLLAANLIRFGPWFAGVATVISFVMGGLILALGGDPDLWLPNMIYGAILLALTLALAFTKRDPIAT